MSKTADAVGIAIIGAGLMGSNHASTVSDSPLAELIGVYSADIDQAKQLADEHKCGVYTSLNDLLSDENVKAVVVATPTDTHLEVAKEVLAHGKHVLIEKPVARTLDDAEQLLRAASDSGLVVSTGHVARYFPEYQRIGELIKTGELGEIAVATLGRRCQKPDWATDGWHTDMNRSGGVAVDMLVHDIDLIRDWFGEPKTVYARVVGSDKYAGLDYALATLTYENGVICHLHGSWAEPDGFSQSAEVCGQKGMVTYDSRARDEVRIDAHNAERTVTALPPPAPTPYEPFQRQLADFVTAIDGGVEPPGNLHWAVDTLRIALAMLESSNQGRAIDLETFGRA